MKSKVTKKPKVKTPAEAFPRCIECGNSALQVFDIDVHCQLCGWNSMEAHVDAGGLDDLYSYFR